MNVGNREQREVLWWWVNEIWYRRKVSCVGNREQREVFYCALHTATGNVQRRGVAGSCYRADTLQLCCVVPALGNLVLLVLVPGTQSQG